MDAAAPASIAVCANCHGNFESKNKGFRRSTLNSELSFRILKCFGIDYSKDVEIGSSERWLCHLCHAIILKIECRQSEIARKEQEITEARSEFMKRALERQNLINNDHNYDVTKRPLSPSKTPRKQKKSKVSHTSDHDVINKICNKNVKPPVYKGFTPMVIKSLKVHKYGRAVRLRLKSTTTASNCTSQAPTQESIESFSWESYVGETKKSLPILHGALEGALTTRYSSQLANM